jgi:hypothetical protein
MDMKQLARYVCAGVISICGSPLLAQWSSSLEGGGTVSVDPQTNRATVTRDGVSTTLWDGVHRLSDGSTITVRSGQAMPNNAIIESRRQLQEPIEDPAMGWVGSPITGLSPCEQLERKVCGVNGLCKQVEACQLAGQLLKNESDERTTALNPDVMTYSSGRCGESLRDDLYFKACAD